MDYQADQLKAKSWVNRKMLDFENWNKDAVYSGPFLNIKAGVFQISDGSQGYQVDFTRKKPIYQLLPNGKISNQ
jgi:hypothetical protein